VLQSVRVENFEHFKGVFRDGDVGDVGVPLFQAVEGMAISKLSADQCQRRSDTPHRHVLG
jgi:hypothetical protein